MNERELGYTVESADFFSIGRVLQRGFGKASMGKVTLRVEESALTIESDCGGGQIPCIGDGSVSATLSAKAFCSLITTRFREKEPSGPMRLVFRPLLKEVAIDRA